MTYERTAPSCTAPKTTLAQAELWTSPSTVNAGLSSCLATVALGARLRRVLTSD
jgi:hypothetical protein